MEAYTQRRFDKTLILGKPMPCKGLAVSFQHCMKALCSPFISLSSNGRGFLSNKDMCYIIGSLLFEFENKEGAYTNFAAHSLTHCILGNFWCFFVVCWFFSKLTFENILSEIPSECQTVWTLIRPDDFVRPDLGPNCLPRSTADVTGRHRVKSIKLLVFKSETASL